MIRVLQRSIEIERPSGEVYAFIADMANYVQWFPGILQMRAVDDLPVGRVGKRYDEVARLPDGKEERVGVVVVESIPQRLLAIEADLLPPLPRFDYEVQSIGERRTRFTWTCRARNTSLTVRPFLLAMRLVIGARLAKALVNLKGILEQPAQAHMSAWQVRRFGDPEQVLLRNPHVARPLPGADEVLVRVTAASVNPIDGLRCTGYGRTLLKAKGAATTPLVLGNDVAGVVESVGRNVSGFAAGDRVFGAKPHGVAGTHAPYCALRAEHLALTPGDVLDEDAAALPYVFLTAWSALVRDAGLGPDNARSKRIFVQGGGTSVGHMAIQLAKAWGAEVTASCSQHSREQVLSAGADRVVDREHLDWNALGGDHDIALACADLSDDERMVALLKPNAGACFVSIVHPMLALADEHGLIKGLFKGARERKARGAVARRQGKGYRWCVMGIEPVAIQAMQSMLSAGQLRSRAIDVLTYNQAMRALAVGRTGGKKVVLRVGAP